MPASPKRQGPGLLLVALWGAHTGGRPKGAATKNLAKTCRKSEGEGERGGIFVLL